VLQSAAFTAGCAVLIRLIADDRGAGARWGWVAVACFALNPMVVIYAGTGMSESAMLFCILWAVRYLLRWLDSPRVFDLASVGLALAVGYLVRYESLIAGAGAAALVAGTTFLRTARGERFAATALSVMVVLFPIVSP
jgi:4-amino-4-deoxy-L-arabinose transferase-like glycosyltransferase